MEKIIKVDVYVLCYNEEKLVPFMLDYWNEFATNVYILDNNSTDNSVYLLKQEKRFNVEIIPYDSNNELNDQKYLELKNNIWKKSIGKCDFVVVCDFDEALFSKNIMEELRYMLNNEQTICLPKIYDMYSSEFPFYAENNFLHQIVKCGIPYDAFGKRIIFNPNKISDINYVPGAHNCNPNGIVKYYNRDNLYLFHFKNLSTEYVYGRYKTYLNRMSEINKKNGWGIQYFQKYEEIDKWITDTLPKTINVNEVIK